MVTAWFGWQLKINYVVLERGPIEMVYQQFDKIWSFPKKEKGPPAGFEPDRNELNANRRPARTPLGHGRISQRRFKLSPIPRITFRFPVGFRCFPKVYFDIFLTVLSLYNNVSGTDFRRNRLELVFSMFPRPFFRHLTRTLVIVLDRAMENDPETNVIYWQNLKFENI